MNYKQKLGYMALGAGILALGIIIGQWVTPDIEAQNNGVFDKIICRENVLVYDLYENMRIGLISSKTVDGIAVWDKVGNTKWGSPQ